MPLNNPYTEPQKESIPIGEPEPKQSLENPFKASVGSVPDMVQTTTEDPIDTAPELGALGALTSYADDAGGALRIIRESGFPQAELVQDTQFGYGVKLGAQTPEDRDKWTTKYNMYNPSLMASTGSITEPFGASFVSESNVPTYEPDTVYRINKKGISGQDFTDLAKYTPVILAGLFTNGLPWIAEAAVLGTVGYANEMLNKAQAYGLGDDQAMEGAAKEALIPAAMEAMGGPIGRVLGTAVISAANKFGKNIDVDPVPQNPVDENGGLTEEMTEWMVRNNVDQDQFLLDVTTAVETASKALDSGLDPAVALRQQRADEFGVELTPAQSSKRFDDNEREQRLLKEASPAGDELRSIYGEQNRQMRQTTEELVPSGRVPVEGETISTATVKMDVGDTVKATVKKRATADKKSYTDMYNKADASPAGKEVVDVDPEDLGNWNTFVDDLDLRNDETARGAVFLVEKKLAEYGLMDPPISPTTGKQIVIEETLPLTAKRARFLQKFFNKKGSNDYSSSYIYSEANKLIGETFEKSGNEALAGYKEANRLFRQYQETYDSASVNNLIKKVKKEQMNAGTEVRADSIYSDLVTGKGSLQNWESFNSLVKGLPKEDVMKVHEELQSAVVLHALDSALSAGSRRAADTGDILFSGTNFIKYLDRTVGQDTLKEIFSTHPERLTQLNRWAQVTGDVTIPPVGTVNFSNTAYTLMNALKDAGAPTGALFFTGFDPMTALGAGAVRAGTKFRAARKAAKEDADFVQQTGSGEAPRRAPEQESVIGEFDESSFPNIVRISNAAKPVAVGTATGLSPSAASEPRESQENITRVDNQMSEAEANRQLISMKGIEARNKLVTAYPDKTISEIYQLVQDRLSQ